MLAWALGLLAVDGSAAATLFVDAAAAPGGDGSAGAPFQTIQDGVDAASAGDLVSVAAGTYSAITGRPVGSALRTAVVFMKNGVAVQGAGAGLTVIDGGGTSTGVIFDGVAVATISGVTVVNGYYRSVLSSFDGGGGIYSNASSPTITNATITGNRAVPFGGGFLMTGGGVATLTGVRLESNQAYDPGGAYPRDGSGGAIAVYGASVALDGSTLDGNLAGIDGGAIYGLDATFTVSAGTLTSNSAASTGGAVYAYGSTLSLSNSLMDSNDALEGGGVALSYGSATITGGAIQYNAALLGDGGGLYGAYSHIKIDGVAMTGNSTGAAGGAAYFLQTSATLTNATIDSNDAALYGAGIAGGYHTRLVLSGGAITGNRASRSGGGVYLSSYSVLAINGTTISGNIASFDGGGIYSYYNQETITNATITNNASGFAGGGIYSGYGIGEISHNVITGNSSGLGYGGGGLYFYASKSLISGNLVGYNTASYGGGIVIYSDCADCFNEASTFATVANNSIVGNTATGGRGGGGLFVEYNSWVAVTNNTIVGNQADAGRGGGLYIDDNEVVYLANNIIQGNSASLGGGVYYSRANGTAPPLITHNDIVGNVPENWATSTYLGVPNPIGSSGNISTDALLSPSGQGTYSLLPGSPALDAGTLTVAGIAGPDGLGAPRVQASAIGRPALVDMGASEFPYPGANNPPTSIAFSGGGFRRNGTLVLDGTRSFDPDGDPLTFLWSQVAGPPVTLSSANSAFTTLLNLGTTRAPAAGPFSNLFSLPTSVLLELTVSDGKASASTLLEVRMLDDAAPTDIDTAGYFFDQESGIPGYKGGIAISPDGSEYFVVTGAEFFFSGVVRGPVVRDPVTARVKALGPAQPFMPLRQGTGLAMHPGGTLFAAEDYFGPSLVRQLVEIRPDGSKAAFDILQFGPSSVAGLAFVPPGPANAGRLLVVDDLTQVIYELQLTANGDGTFTPTASRLFVDLSLIPGLRLTAVTFLGPDGGPSDLLAFGANDLGVSNTAYRVALDPASGDPVGGPSAPVITNAYEQTSSYSLFGPFGAVRDPLSAQILVSNPYGDYPYASTLVFDPLPLDLDRDGAPDNADNCPSTPNAPQTDSNRNGVGDPCDNVAVANAPPVANAGPDQAVNELDLVTLDGSASFDPDGGTTLTYTWVQTGGPAVTLAGAGTVGPTFTAPAVGPAGVTLTFSLQVSDGFSLSPADTVDVTIANVNSPPVIGTQVLPGTTVPSGTVVTLDARSTLDPDLDPITFLWTQQAGPLVTLSDPASALTTFTAPPVTVLSTVQFQLAASDGIAASTAVVSVVITPPAAGLPPVADAGLDTRATPLTGSVVLDGSGSFDPEAQPLTFSWAQLAGPSAPLANAATAMPTVDVSGVAPSQVLLFELTVGDGTATTADTVAVQVIRPPEWHQFRHDEVHSGRTSAVGPTASGSAFSLTLPAGIRSSVSFDYVDGMYVGADDGKLYALNLDGTIRWSFPTGGSVRTTPLVAADGTIYFGSFDGNFYAVDASGVERWRQPTGAGGFFRFSSPILDPATGYVVVGASDGVLRAFDAATGDPVWGSPAAGPIYASPVAVGGKVLFGSNDGRVRVLDSATGDLLDVIDIGAAVQSSPAVDVPFGRLFVGAEDGSVRAFDLATGDLLWTTPTGGTVTSSPALDLSRGRIYVGSDDHSLYALDVTTGAVAWQHPTGEAVRSSPTVDAAGNIYVGSCDGNVYGFDASGVLLFTFFSSGLIIPSPTLGTDGLLYIGSDDHYLYAIGPDPFGGVPLRAARVDQVEPAGAIQGETIEVAVRGADLGEGIELAFGAGVRVLERYAVSSREVRARLAIEPAAALGPRDVVVSSREGLPSTQVRGFEIGFDCRRADLSGDGSVDGIDLALLASRFGGRSAAGDMGDLDGSSGVDGIDLALLAARFGAGASCR